MSNFKNLLFLTLVLLFTACKTNKNQVSDTTNQAPQQRGGQAPPSIDELFKMDQNGDGLLSKTEVKGRILERFDTIDTSGDGLLSREEVSNMPKPKKGQRGQRPPRN